MKQMVRRAWAIAALVGLTACVDDPQELVNNDDFNTVLAYPTTAWARANTDSTPVLVRLVNDFGYGTPTRFTISDVQGPIVVHHDSLFRRYYTSAGPNDTTLVPYVDGHLQRFWVLKPTPGNASFKVTAANGVSTTVKFRIEAGDIGTLPTQTAVAGQLITLTAPAFQRFAPDAQVTYQRGARPAKFPDDTAVARSGTATSAGPVVDRAADGSSLTFRAAADLVGRVTVTRTYPLHDGVTPDMTPVALSSIDTLKVPGYGTSRGIDYTFGLPTDTVSTTGGSIRVGAATAVTPNVGDVVRVTLGGLPGSSGNAPATLPLTYMATSRIFFGGVEAGIIHSGTAASSAAISPDSNAVDVLVPAHVASGAGGTIPVTVQNVAFSFDPTYLFGTAAAAATAVQAGNPAVLKVGTVVSTASPANTVGAIPTNYAGTNSRATAPQLPIIDYLPTPASQIRSIMINDGAAMKTGSDCGLSYGSVPIGCKIYKIGIETTRAVEYELRWAEGVTATMGVYVLQTGNTVASLRTALSGTGGLPASGVITGVTTAYQYIVVTQYSGTPVNWTQLRVTFR